jgi:hypothetical protein
VELFVLGTELKDEQIGPALAARVRGGLALEFTETTMDIARLAKPSGSKYFLEELDKLYVRPDFERIFAGLMRWV